MDKVPDGGQLQITKWQNKLLPFMIRTIIFLAIFYFLASLGQFIYLESKISEVPKLDENWVSHNNDNSPLYELEYILIQRRYHQGNTSLMSRLWLKYIGFITGMTLSLIGAVFVLGKLREDSTEFEVNMEKVKMTFLSSSPGIILAFLGTLIMITSILDNKPIDIIDSNIYVGTSLVTSPSITETDENRDSVKHAEAKIENVVIPESRVHAVPPKKPDFK